MLRLTNLNAYYDRTRVLHQIDLHVDANEIVGLVGANGAGKSSTLLSIMGVKTRSEGEIWFNDKRIDHLPTYERVRRAIVLIPERRRLFPFMSVLENLELGAFLPMPRQKREETLASVFELLPILAERRHQVAGSLSGGEQQMCAIGRGLMSRPRLLLLDELSLGLAPIVLDVIADAIARIHRQGTAILLVEQDVAVACDLADTGYVLENGRIALSGSTTKLKTDPHVERLYLGL